MTFKTVLLDDVHADNRRKAKEVLDDYQAGRALCVVGDGWLVRMCSEVQHTADLIDRQREEIGRKNEALRKAAEQFSWYAQEHHEKAEAYLAEGKKATASISYEKAEVNHQKAAMCLTALSDTTREGLGAATPKTAQHRGCSGTGEDDNG